MINFWRLWYRIYFAQGIRKTEVYEAVITSVNMAGPAWGIMNSALMRCRFLAAAAALFLSAAHGQAPAPPVSWTTATELAGIDFSALTPPQKALALKVMREAPCVCGCSMKLAECRIKDPGCTYSRVLGVAAVKWVHEGKGEPEVRKSLTELKITTRSPGEAKLLEDPVQIAVEGAPSLGPAGAKVTIVEFSDFQCPYCAMAAPKAQAVLKEFPNDVRLVFKQYPLESHSQAMVAAQASLAAHAQGKFWPLHDKMFANFRSLSRANILAWAKETGLDMKRFEADLDSGKYKAIVEKEIEQGNKADVQGTPTFYLNGKRYNGAMDLAAIKPVIERELGRKPAAAAAKPAPPPVKPAPPPAKK